MLAVLDSVLGTEPGEGWTQVWRTQSLHPAFYAFIWSLVYIIKK